MEYGTHGCGEEDDLRTLKCCTQFTGAAAGLLPLTTESPKYFGSISFRIRDMTLPSYNSVRDEMCLGFRRRLNVFT
jgi:hypothetical protein